ncbi:MAG: NADPH-dependent glutamate synthase [Capsulimonadaceae bacterium]|nr:NADPH-dependent glutamate synthase [Capsulimonadaceae bacterium]
MSSSNNPLPPKERLQIVRQSMPEQDPLKRAHNFEEVNLGFTDELALQEATRCLGCGKPRCVQGCPVGVKIAEFVDLIVAKDYLGAAAKIREDNVLPAVTGRVCPQEEQCEGSCLLAHRAGSSSLGIGYLERFVADYERTTGQIGLPACAPSSGKKVAIAGSGPAGLSCAGDLVQRGHDVTVFEALHEIGGVLVYGIPEFRLPKDIVRQEVDNMRKLGVKFETNVVIGKTVTVDELFEEEGFDAVFIATGAGLPKFMGIPGENLCAVYSANEFLTRVNLMKAYRFPEYDEPVFDCAGKNVGVIGGGNTAMDAVRTSLRLGAKNAYLIYRRTEKDMPARIEELHHAKQEGVQIMDLWDPVEYIGDEKGWVRAAKLRKMQQGEPDESGRSRPVPIPGSETEVALDMVVVAVGNTSNPLVQQTTPGLDTDTRGRIVADHEHLRTSKKGVFAGGDIVSGAATVILAMGAGRTAAASIHDYLTTGEW